MLIDAHFHCWQLARGDYGWLTPALAPIYRDVAVRDWQAESSPFGVAGGVLVQAAPTEAETHFLLRQADSHPEVLGVVGWADLLAPDAPLAFREWQPATPLLADRYGIPTPTTGDWLQPDLILLPLNGFDAAAYRLGYGGGFYDRYLSIDNTFIKAALAFDFQLLESIPYEEHDLKPDYIITQTQFIRRDN